MPAPKINPKARRNPIYIKLPQYLIDWLDQHNGPRADYIEAAMLEHYDIKKPERKLKSD